VKHQWRVGEDLDFTSGEAYTAVTLNRIRIDMKLFILSLVGLGLTACGPAQDTQLERKLVAASSSDSIVDLSSIVRERWDHVCIIAAYTPPESAKQLTGVDWNGFKRAIPTSDGSNLLVFVKRPEIVRYAEVARRVDFNPRSVCTPRDSARFRPHARSAQGPGHFVLELAHS